jgi:hypothetical protein
MAYIGNTPAESFASFEKQVFTIVNSQTAYTLNHAVTNENDIRLVVNSVVQEPGSGKAYTASGTTLTLSAALTNGTDTMYCVFLGRALQTVNAPNASVGSDQTAPTIITGQTAETSIATDDTILIHDTSASALRKMTRANFVSGIGGVNTPCFSAKLSSATSLPDNTATKIEFGTEVFDVGGCYNNTSSAATLNGISVPSYSFAPNVSGKYIIGASFRMDGGDDWDILDIQFGGGTIDNRFSIVHRRYNSLSVSGIVSFNGTGNAVHVEGFQVSGSTKSLYNSARDTWFFAYKIIE